MLISYALTIFNQQYNMNTQEHLQRIKSKCEQLLELAEKRTPGKWMGTNLADVFTDTEDAANGVAGHHIADCDPSCDKTVETARSDRNFVVSCAGPAEAGWRATIAAIDGLLPLSQSPNVDTSCEALEAFEQDASCVRDVLSAIIAAWPIELL